MLFYLLRFVITSVKTIILSVSAGSIVPSKNRFKYCSLNPVNCDIILSLIGFPNMFLNACAISSVGEHRSSFSTQNNILIISPTTSLGHGYPTIFLPFSSATSIHLTFLVSNLCIVSLIFYLGCVKGAADCVETQYLKTIKLKILSDFNIFTNFYIKMQKIM